MLETCRHYLEAAYRQKLGTDFSDSLAQLEAGRQPVWRFVSPDDLTTEISPNDRAVGLLLDPEIGLVFYLAPFDSNTNLRQQIICAVALSSRLSIQAGSAMPPSEPGDLRGPWHVVLHWLVDRPDRETWMREIAELRRESAFSEDLSVDAIFVQADGDLENELARHGFPRLLLETRAVLRKEHIEDVARWMSADELVKAALAGFESRFQNPGQRALAQGIVETIEQVETAGAPPSVPGIQAGARTLDRIRIENFRNLASVELDFGTRPVSATIVHGLNATGKSSLCEAISLALFGSSSSYKAFSDRTREKDVSATDRGREYVARYLTSFGSASGSPEDVRPKIGLNDEPLDLPPLVGASDTGNADLAMDGTILHQETTLEFCRMSAQELSARILRGYSGLADQVEEYTDNCVLEASSNRQDFLRTLGLSAAISKLDTAFERMARREVDRSLPGFPRALVDWLDAIPGGAQLAWRWQEWGNEPGRKAFAVRLSQLDASPANLEIEIRAWLGEFNTLAARSSEAVKDIDARMGSFRSELDQLAARMGMWGEWLEANRAASPALSAERAGSEPQLTSTASKLDQLQAEQQRVIEQGRNAARHFDHLTQVEAYVRETWGKQEADRCPTCGTNHADRGGILPVIQAWRQETAAERDRLRSEYSRLKAEIAELEKSFTGSGPERCPVTAGEQSRIVEAFRWLVPAQADFGQWIAVRSQREGLLAVISALNRVPAVPARVDSESEAARVAGDLALQFADARRVFEAPSNWKPVKEKLTAMLADIVNQHLPRTVGALWSELFLNLTPAPWLLPDRPSIDVATRRGEQGATLQIQGRLARYILNQSEVHILGLGWFLTRYLTRGRFAHACLVMDDPARDLDQAGFRDLCRLWETLVRLHLVYERPVRLIVTLNDETRALEAARAVGGTISYLGWKPEQGGTLCTARVVPEDVLPAQPARLFHKIAS